MPYNAHTWVRGETISSALLNNMEQGIKAAQDLAEKANDAAELRAAFNMLASQTRAMVRELEERITALESH